MFSTCCRSTTCSAFPRGEQACFAVSRAHFSGPCTRGSVSHPVSLPYLLSVLVLTEWNSPGGRFPQSLTLLLTDCFLSTYRRAKVARVIGLLASHTAELQEHAPVIEVIALSPEMLRMTEGSVPHFVTWNTQISLPFRKFSPWDCPVAIK